MLTPPEGGGPGVPLNGSCVRGRVVPLLPGRTRFASLLASRLGQSEQDIKEALDEVGRRRRRRSRGRCRVGGRRPPAACTPQSLP